MKSLETDPRMQALRQIIAELKSLRAFLDQANRDRADKVTFTSEIGWIDEALSRIEPLAHTRRWPPLWWRLGKVDVDLLHRNFQRFDSEGAYVDRSRRAGDDGYIAERNDILKCVDRMYGLYKAAYGMK